MKQANIFSNFFFSTLSVLNMSRLKQTYEIFITRCFVISILFVFLLWFSYINSFLKEPVNLVQILNSSVGSEKLVSNFKKHFLNDDNNTLIDLTNFEFLLNHKPCKNLTVTPEVVILIHSAPVGFQKRQVIRETWGEIDSRSILLFLLGSVNNASLQQKIYEEYEVSFSSDCFKVG